MTKRFHLALLLGSWLAGPLFAQSTAQQRQQIRAQTDARLHAIIDTTAGVMGVAALDLVGDDDVLINADQVFPQGSTIKIPILMEVYRQAEAGTFALSDRRTLTDAVKVGGSGQLQTLGTGSELTIYDLCVLMISISDNTATNMLIDLVGMDRVNQTMADLGLEHTRLQRKMMDTAARARGDENLSTPAEAAQIMEMLHRGTFVSRAASDEMLAILRKTGGGDLAAGVPGDVAVPFKPGGIPGVSTEWALVELDAQPYALVVMGNYGRGGFDAAMTALSRTLYDYYWRMSRASAYGTYVDPAQLNR
jgi:beta-lactamase class A